MSTEVTITSNTNLPATIEDLSKFVLIGREKLTAVRAEIRAIDKLNLAQEVHEQKQEEASMLAEALLDAEVKLGELFKEIPHATHNRGNQHTGGKSTSKSVSQKSKKEVVHDLGFSEKQAERLEMLADNPDAVEFVKAEARGNAEIPTRKRVLEVVSQKKKGSSADNYDSYFKFHMKVCGELGKIVDAINKFEVSEARIEALLDNFSGATGRDTTIRTVEDARDRLNQLAEGLRKYAKKKAG